MGGPRRNDNDRRQAGDLCRAVAVDRRSIAKLAVEIVAPGPDAAVGTRCDRVIPAGSDGNVVATATDGNRRAAFDLCPVSELSDTVAAPRPKRAVGAQPKGVIPARGDRCGFAV